MFRFQQMEHPDSTIIIHLLALTVSCSNLFVYCYFGKIGSESYERMPQYLFESDWMEHPVKMQKYVLLMIGNAQIPLYYNGFGISNLNLETFTTVNEMKFGYKSTGDIIKSLVLISVDPSSSHFLYDVQDIGILSGAEIVCFEIFPSKMVQFTLKFKIIVLTQIRTISHAKKEH